MYSIAVSKLIRLKILKEFCYWPEAAKTHLVCVIWQNYKSLMVISLKGDKAAGPLFDKPFVLLKLAKPSWMAWFLRASQTADIGESPEKRKHGLEIYNKHISIQNLLLIQMAYSVLSIINRNIKICWVDHIPFGPVFLWRSSFFFCCRPHRQNCIHLNGFVTA